MTRIPTQKGIVIIMNTLLFFALSTAIIFALTSPVISSFHITKSFSKSKEAFLLANSAANEAVYKLNSGKNLSPTETFTLSQGEALISVADNMGVKIISIDSDVDSYQRNYEVEVSIGDGVSFNYGLQAGQGGFDMTNNATIQGNVYSSGDIIGVNNAYITGTAVSSNVSDPLVVESNNGIVDPGYQIDFGGNNSSVPQDIAQSFAVSTTTPISSIRILIKKTGSPSNTTLRIKDNNSNSPGNTTYAQGTISASTVTDSFGYLTIPLNITTSLVPGSTYWIVFDGSNFGPNKYYTVGANDSIYVSGISKMATNGSNWSDVSPTSRDLYFDVYVGGETGLIKGMTIGGDARAHTIEDSNVVGTIYCQSGYNNDGKICDTSQPDPLQQPWPISEGNIQEWKGIATAGVATSSISLSDNSVLNLDSTKVTGNISLSGDSIIYLNGILYVTGNITLSNQSQIKVNPALGSSGVVIVSDGRIKTSNSGQFNGSGISGSYIMVVTTSSCPSEAGCGGSDAIEIANNSGSVILNAQNGTIDFSNNASAKQATAYRIEMTNNTVVTYEEGLINPSFTTGPSGAWNVSSWKEVE